MDTLASRHSTPVNSRWLWRQPEASLDSEAKLWQFPSSIFQLLIPLVHLGRRWAPVEFHPIGWCHFIAVTAHNQDRYLGARVRGSQVTISILAISKMFRAKWPSIIEGNTWKEKYLEILGDWNKIFNPILDKNGDSARAHASEETLISNRFLWDNVAPAMEGDQSSRDMTAFGYRQKNYAQGCRQNNFEELRSSDQGAILCSKCLKSKKGKD